MYIYIYIYIYIIFLSPQNFSATTKNSKKPNLFNCKSGPRVLMKGH